MDQLKVGDRVRINSGVFTEYRDRLGTVVDVYRHSYYPYDVRIDNSNHVLALSHKEIIHCPREAKPREVKVTLIHKRS